jgi:hypothetical protein
MKEAQNLERSLHVNFSHLRMSGEWFKAKQELINYIENCKSYNLEETVFSKPKPNRKPPHFRALSRLIRIGDNQQGLLIIKMDKPRLEPRFVRLLKFSTKFCHEWI